jgi:hypothetical protein
MWLQTRAKASMRARGWGTTGYKVGDGSRARYCLRAALPSPIQACCHGC